ncbi:MAG: LemA family protein [Bacilli bacterium]
MVIVYTILLLFVFICGLGIGYIILYNNLQHYTTRVEQAEAIIDETLRNRYDLINEAINIIESVVGNKKAFKDFDKLKDERISNFDLDRRLTETVLLIKQIKSDYDKVNENKDLKKIMTDIRTTDEKIQAAKAYYNKYMGYTNDAVRKFPSNLIARMHNIKVKPFFDGKDMQDDIIDDFKL